MQRMQDVGAAGDAGDERGGLALGLEPEVTSGAPGVRRHPVVHLLPDALPVVSQEVAAVVHELLAELPPPLPGTLVFGPAHPWALASHELRPAGRGESGPRARQWWRHVGQGTRLTVATGR